MEQQSPQFKPTPVALVADEDEDAKAKPSGLLRFTWVFAGAILPIICFVAGTSIFANRSQSLSGYAGLLLSLDGSLPLMPLLLICMGSVLVLASRPHDVENGWGRLGVFSGMVLSLEYWFVFQVAISNENAWSMLPLHLAWGVIWSTIVVVVPWFFGHLVSSAFTAPRERYFGCASVALSVLGIIAVISFPYSLLLVGAPCLLCSTPWAVAAYTSAAIWMFRCRKGPAFQFTLWQLLAATTWFAANFAAWRTAILMMLERTALH